MLLQLAWLGVPDHRYRVTFHEAWGGSSEVPQVLKVRAEMDADAGGALGMVGPRAQVSHPFLLQAAGVAARVNAVVACGRSGAGGHLLKRAREHSTGCAGQGGERPSFWDRLAGGERQPLHAQLCILTVCPVCHLGSSLLVFIFACASTKSTLLHSFCSKIQSGHAVAYCDGRRSYFSTHSSWPDPFIDL